jgi:hypothetical protein
MHKKVALLLAVFLALGIFLGTSRSASAQEDPPTRVARLNFVEGNINYQPGGDDDQEWVVADRNRPLTTGDDLWSDQDSRGEIHIGSTAIRMGAQTGISFLNLDDNTIQIQLTQGVIEVHIRHYNPDNAYEIDTPNLAFTIYAPGKYRIQADPDGYSTMILVRDGQGQVTGAGQTFDITPQQAYTFSGGDQLTYDVQPAFGPDEFEHWSQERDLREDASASARYVSPDMNGYYDLDENGDWQNDPEYGPVWIPRAVAAGWAPYHDGHWVWIAPWGWTWVDAQPWGFAPFHYGRWAQVRGGYWGWVPGPPAVRPVYAPALVAFVGGGPSFGASIGFGGGFAGVAWFPLGPRDVFVPSYRTSAAYVQNVNVSNTRVVNVTQVTNVYNSYHVTNTTVNNITVVNKINYTYANNPAAVTAVTRETFVGARPVSASAVRVTPQQLQTVRVTEAAPLAPTRASYVSSVAHVTPAAGRPPVAFAQTKVVARIAPPAPPARPGAAPRVAPPIVSAGVAPKGDRPAARTNPAGAAVKATPPPARANNNNNTNRPPNQAQPANNAPAAARPVAPAPNPQPQPGARPNNNQPRPSPDNRENQTRPAPEQPATPPAAKPVPPPAAAPAKNPPPPPVPNARENQRDVQQKEQNDQREARPPVQPQPKPQPPPAVRPQPTPPPTPAPETAAEAKERQKQADKAKKDEDKKDKDKPKNQPQL